ncbi:hypothetical protein TNIN_373191 [Trichonephila inaurata madagascariensis]|uniref:Uncharacterized protein n=1 Tax=Trichonephila inaurata madagascariensis TaxID=2747483 RepID=A0A8X6Y8M5_9ARAC|nr:hypothetical protein TNIN_373191 [Trichonephila inaurata madagascariensis]
MARSSGKEEIPPLKRYHFRKCDSFLRRNGRVITSRRSFHSAATDKTCFIGSLLRRQMRYKDLGQFLRWFKVTTSRRSVMPVFESYGRDRSRRHLLDLYNSPRYPYYSYGFPDNYYQENNHENVFPPTRPRSPVEQMRQVPPPSDPNDARRCTLSTQHHKLIPELQQSFPHLHIYGSSAFNNFRTVCHREATRTLSGGSKF